MSKPKLSWNVLLFITALVACLYVLNSWLFTVTKPSYVSNLALTQQIQILLVTSTLFVGLCTLGLLPLAILSCIPQLTSYTSFIQKLGAWLPATVFATLILMMVDNFTYTLFKFGIVSTEGLARGVYGLGFLALIVLCYRRVVRIVHNLSQLPRNQDNALRWTLGLMAGMIALSVIISMFSSRPGAPKNTLAEIEQRPHILLVTSDGINATHTSAYGYERDTTPHMRELAESSLVFENAFSNSGNTGGAIISIYTGKYPADTRVLYKPDILKGEDAYEHLPGILRSHGYKTIQITMPYYLDANGYNVLDGFDNVIIDSAEPSKAEQSKYLDTIRKYIPNEPAFFIDQMIKRIADRIRHIFFIKKMVNPYDMVMGSAGVLYDLERLESMKQFIQNASQPIFIHVHFMGTHGEKFDPRVQTFSIGRSVDSQEPWDDDFYDDSILEFDTNLGALVDFLTNQGLIDNTILIVGSDHGQQYNQTKRLPLMIRFPHGQHVGNIKANVQGLDIPATILDYIGLEIPEWMDSTSLIDEQLGQRPIFGVSNLDREQIGSGFFEVNWEKISPPFYQFSEISIIYCQKWYKLGLTELSWETGEVEGSTSVCQPGNEITDEQAFEWMVEHLSENGFDVSTLDRIPQ